MDYKDMTDEQLRGIAEKRVEARNGFGIHLMVYLMVNALLVVIYITSGGGHPWFLYPLFGWGIGIAAHAIETRSMLSKKGATAVDEEMDKLRRM